MKLPLSPVRRLVVLLALLLSSHAVVQAQDMRVYTNVSVINERHKGGEPVSHSLTLFHAGKVYDYMVDVEEVVIFEPNQHRFMILGPDYTATEVPYSQVLQFLKSADGIAAGMLKELAEKKDTISAQTAAAIQFQLNPEFEIVADQPERLLLKGELFSYHVATARIESSQLTEQYLDYADWAARLNYVLHPQTLLPKARLMLNEQLRKRGELPVSVTLTNKLDGTSQLRAEHQFSWQLQSADKLSISQWERTLASDQVHWVSFHEYQQHLLAKANR